jgi:Ca2+-transporting ATPase
MWAFLAGVALLALVLLVPMLGKLFAVTALTSRQLLTIVGLAFLPTLVIQLVKVICDRVKK